MNVGSYIIACVQQCSSQEIFLDFADTIIKTSNILCLVLSSNAAPQTHKHVLPSLGLFKFNFKKCLSQRSLIKENTAGLISKIGG